MNCWEYMKCPRSKKQQCDVFIYGHGKECWAVPKEGIKIHTPSKHTCLNCQWYIKNYRAGKI
ncbi:MAG: hypothetical protein QCH96_00795 [Candidatus Thermoplasmatota archaeon]|nr:hypothetical protein [Candidatus Thermoplasmatota archaeon]